MSHHVSSVPVSVTTRDYSIDPQTSTVTFTTRHVYGLGAVRGSFGRVEGVVRVREPHTASTVELTIPTGTFASGNKRRDSEVLSPKYLDPAQFPTISFRSTRVRTDATGSGAVEGILTAHGVDKPITVDIQAVNVADGGIVVEATATVDRFEFGVTSGRGLAGRRLLLTFRIVATPNE